MKEEQRSGRPSTSADPVHDVGAALQTDVCIAELELRFNP